MPWMVYGLASMDGSVAVFSMAIENALINQGLTVCTKMVDLIEGPFKASSAKAMGSISRSVCYDIGVVEAEESSDGSERHAQTRMGSGPRC